MYEHTYTTKSRLQISTLGPSYASSKIFGSVVFKILMFKKVFMCLWNSFGHSRVFKTNNFDKVIAKGYGPVLG